MAVIYMPAFWAGHLYALASDEYPADGFSAPYQLAVLFYSLFLVGLGLFFLRKLGLVYFSDKIVALAIVILCFGSNYFQLTSTNTSSPHAILFTFYAILLFLVYKWHLNPTYRLSTLMASFFGIMVLARPNELLFCLIPIFWGVSSWSSFKDKLSFFLKNYKYLFFMLCIMACIGALQIMYWKFSSGQWLFDSYTNEDFKLLSPYLSEYLFSYKKVWLLYSPIFLLLIVGYVQLFKRSKQLFLPFLLHFIFTVWVLSSWDNWWYADSFSQRSIVQCYPAFFIPFAFAVDGFLKQKVVLKYISFTLILLIIGLNLFQTYQVKKEIIHTQSMSKAYYWEVFGKTKSDDSSWKLLEPERGVNFLPQYLNYNDRSVFSTASKITLSSTSPFSKKWSFAAKDISEAGFLYLNVGAVYKINKVENASLGVVFQTLDTRSKKHYSYVYEHKPIPTIDSSYQKLSVVYAPPFLRSLNDSIEVYFWLNGNASIEVEQLNIQVFDPRAVVSKKSRFSFGAIGKNNYWSSAFADSTNKNGYFYQIDSVHAFSATLERMASLVDFKSGKYQIYIEGYNTAEKAEVYAVISLNEGDENNYYKAFRLPKAKNTWETWTFDGEISKPISEKASLKFYLWKKSKAPFYYKRISLDFKK